MMRRISGLASCAMFTGCIVLTCSSCAVFQRSEVTVPSRLEAAEPRGARLVQLAYGRDAAFGVCVEPACPKVTPKTLPKEAAPQPVVLREPVAPQEPVRDVARLAAAPAPSRPPSPPREPEPRTIVVNFAFGSADLTSDSKAAIRGSIEHARQADRIVISGRTDAVGDEKVNEALAIARALAVRDYFLDVAPDLPAAIAINAKGRCCFVASNADGIGRSKNRRVEIAFTHARGA